MERVEGMAGTDIEVAFFVKTCTSCFLKEHQDNNFTLNTN